MIVISQVIISFEALSLITQINIPAFMACNILFFVGSAIVWNFKNRPVLNFTWIKLLVKNIKKALLKDRILLVLSIFFIFSSLVSLYLAVYAPINLLASMMHQVARVAFWIQHGTFASFETSSVRQIIFPPNSGIFLLWPMLFIKKDFLLGMVQYLSCLGSIFVIYCFLSYLKISINRILWTIFVFASLPAIIVHSSSTQDHLFLGFLLLFSLYLFIYGVYENEKKSLIFSALALAISIGTKSSVFLFLPGIFIAYLLIAIKKEGKNFYKIIFQYFLYFIPALILFSSYFYVMNFLEFGNPLGLKSFIYEHTYSGRSFKSFLANFIRYIFGFIDFTGFDYAKVLNFPVLLTKTILFKFLGFSDTQGLMHGKLFIDDMLLVNIKIHDFYSFLGPLGFLIFLPSLFLSITKYIFSKSNRTFLIGICGLIFVVFIVAISFIMGYQLWNIRYLITAAVIGAPVLAFSYIPGNRISFKKLVIFAVCIFCFVKIPLFNELHPVFPIKGMSLLTNSRNEIRYNTGLYNNIYKDPIEYLNKVAKDNTKIGLIFPDILWYYQFFTENPTWKIYPLNFKLLTAKKMKKLDYLVVYGKEQKLYSLSENTNFDKKTKIDFDKIIRYFDLVYSVETKLDPAKYKDTELGNGFKFYIYRRKVNNTLE